MGTHAAASVTLNPFLWGESDFVAFLALTFIVAVAIAFLITALDHAPTATPAQLSTLEFAGLYGEEALIHAIEIELLARGVLYFEQPHSGWFASAKRRRSQLNGDYLLHSFDGIYRWALIKLVERDHLSWHSSSTPTALGSENAYRVLRERLYQNTWLRPTHEVHKQRLLAVAFFAVPLALTLGGFACFPALQSEMAFFSLVTLLASWLSYTNQRNMSHAALACVKQTRLRLSKQAKFAPEDHAIAFALDGYQALLNSQMDDFARYRIKLDSHD